METTTTAQRFFLFISTGFAVAIIVGLAVWQSGLSAKQSASTGEAGMSQAAQATVSIRAAQLEPRNTPDSEQPKATPLASPNLSEDVFNDPLLPPRAYIAPEHISPTPEAAASSVRTMPTPNILGNSSSNQSSSTEQSKAATSADRESNAVSQSTAQATQTSVDNPAPITTPIDPRVIPTDIKLPTPQVESPMAHSQPEPTANEPTDSLSSNPSPAVPTTTTSNTAE